MNREGKSGKEYAKHISMELTADGARVTNLSLEGSRLVLTIEAELAGSQLRSGDAASRDTAPQPEATAEEAQQRPTSATSSSLGLAQPDDTSPRSFGSENLPPASAAFMPDQTEDASQDTLSTTMQNPSKSLMVAPTAIVDDEPQPAVGPTLFTQAASQETVSIPPATPDLFEQDILTEHQPAPLTESGPLVPPPLPVHEIKEGEAPTPWQAPELTSEDSTRDVTHSAPVSERVTPPPMPIPDPTVMKPTITESLSDNEMALSEESSIIGGARHGEPQPSISFGQDAAALSASSSPEQAEENKAHDPTSEKKEEPATVTAPPEQPQKQIEPEKPQAESSDPESEKSKSDENKSADNAAVGGGTTVLIRYTCPKCKTQGMQAVDKVGTVVNCSNCGKAMRLVMKK